MQLVQGLTQQEVRARQQRGESNAASFRSSRSYRDIIRTNLFNFFNNILFAIGIALIALGQYSDAFTSVGQGVVLGASEPGQAPRAAGAGTSRYLCRRAGHTDHGKLLWTCTPGAQGSELKVMLVTLPLWFLSLRTIWRAKLFDRLLTVGDRS